MRLLERQNEQLSRELEIKNKQIEDLSVALVAAQQTAQAAQTLHAGTRHKQLAEPTEPAPGETAAVEVVPEPPEPELQEPQEAEAEPRRGFSWWPFGKKMIVPKAHTGYTCR